MFNIAEIFQFVRHNTLYEPFSFNVQITLTSLFFTLLINSILIIFLGKIRDDNHIINIKCGQWMI